MSNTYNTRNPLGSTAPKDLYDNASNFDEALNSPSPAWIDRFGKRRQTWAGFETATNAALVTLGYVYTNPVDYAAGIVISAPNQIFRKDGEYFRAGPNLALPYITTGDWPTEGPFFVSVGDAVLRSQLSSSTGAGMIGYGSSTVGAVLDKLSRTHVNNVLDFGAVGDGSTDCTSAFQQAADAAGYGGTVFIPRGRYFLSATIVLRGATKLVGTGIGSSVITRTGDYGDTFRCGSVADQSEPARSFECRFLEMSHSVPFTPGSSALPNLVTFGAHLNLYGCQEALIEGCWFHRMRYQVYCNGGSWVKVLNCQFYGIWDPQTPALQETVGQLVAYPNSVHGNPTTWVVQNNNFLGATAQRGVTYTPASGNREIFRIDTIGAQYGFLIQGLEDLDCHGNYFGGQSIAEIAILNAAGGGVIDYRIYSNFFDGISKGYGILLSPAAANTLSLAGSIQGNIFTDSFHAIFINRNAVSGTVGAYNCNIQGNIALSGIATQVVLGGLIGGDISGNRITDYNKHNVTDSDVEYCSAILIYDLSDKLSISANSLGGGGNGMANSTSVNFCYFGVIRSGDMTVVQRNFYYGIRDNGNFRKGIVESENIFVHGVTANYQMRTCDDHYVRNSVGSGASSVALPAFPMAGAYKTVADGKGDAATSPITVTTSDGSLIRASSSVINTAFGFAAFRFNGASWNKVS